MTLQSDGVMSDGVMSVAPGLSTDFGAPEKSVLRRAKLAFWAPFVGLGVIIFVCFIVPLVLPIPSPTGGSIVVANHGVFTAGHLLGTDPTGNDNLSRLLYGGRISLEVGFGVGAIGLFVGGALGAIAGLKGGLTDLVIARIFDALLSFPALVLAIVVATYLGPSETHVMYALTFFSVPAFGRLARANTFGIRSLVFITAARLAGISDRKILLRHIAPNLLPSLLTFSFLGVSLSIIGEAALSFLGLGIPPPTPSWGNMISLGEQYLTQRPVLLFIPATGLFLMILLLNLAGDALRSRWAE
jgi:peptide/nickel transport system permease protein